MNETELDECKGIISRWISQGRIRIRPGSTDSSGKPVVLETLYDLKNRELSLIGQMSLVNGAELENTRRQLQEVQAKILTLNQKSSRGHISRQAKESDPEETNPPPSPANMAGLQ